MRNGTLGHRASSDEWRCDAPTAAQARRVRTRLVVAKLATHQAPRSRNAPQVIGKLFEARVPRMTSPMAWIGRTLWIAASQPGSTSAPDSPAPN